MVSFYPADRLKNWARRFELPFNLASDTTREAYRRYGLGTINGINSKTVVSIVEGFKSFTKVGKVPEHMQHADQLGGYFIVDSRGKLTYAHAADSAVDNPDVAELLRGLDVSSKA